MKVDFTKPLLNFKDELLKDPTGKNILTKDIVCNSISTVTDASKDDKQILDHLAKVIWSANEEIDLTPEEATLIRKHIEHLPASLFTQIYRLLS